MFGRLDLPLQRIDTARQLAELLRQPAFGVGRTVFHAMGRLLQPFQALLDAAQADDQHVILGFEAIEAAMDAVDVPDDLVEPGVDVVEPAVHTSFEALEQGLERREAHRTI